MSTIAKNSQGFVYLVSVTGVTGTRDSMEGRVEDLVKMLHDVTDKSVSEHTHTHIYKEMLHDVTDRPVSGLYTHKGRHTYSAHKYAGRHTHVQCSAV